MFDASFFAATASRDAEAMADASLLVLFAREPVENAARSEQAGRPIFDEIETVMILQPGGRDVVGPRPTTDADRKRFARQYAEFKARDRGPTQGTALEAWPAITRAKLFELRAVGIRTVEEIAAFVNPHYSASGVPSMPFDRHQLGIDDELVARAQAFLDLARDSATAERLAAENVRMRGQLERAQSEITRLSAEVARLTGLATASAAYQE